MNSNFTISCEKSIYWLQKGPWKRTWLYLKCLKFHGFRNGELKAGLFNLEETIWKLKREITPSKTLVLLLIRSFYFAVMCMKCTEKDSQVQYFLVLISSYHARIKLHWSTINQWHWWLPLFDRSPSPNCKYVKFILRFRSTFPLSDVLF